MAEIAQIVVGLLQAPGRIDAVGLDKPRSHTAPDSEDRQQAQAWPGARWHDDRGRAASGFWHAEPPAARGPKPNRPRSRSCAAAGVTRRRRRQMTVNRHGIRSRAPARGKMCSEGSAPRALKPIHRPPSITPRLAKITVMVTISPSRALRAARAFARSPLASRPLRQFAMPLRRGGIALIAARHAVQPHERLVCRISPARDDMGCPDFGDSAASAASDSDSLPSVANRSKANSAAPSPGAKRQPDALALTTGKVASDATSPRLRRRAIPPSQCITGVARSRLAAIEQILAGQAVPRLLIGHQQSTPECSGPVRRPEAGGERSPAGGIFVPRWSVAVYFLES